MSTWIALAIAAQLILAAVTFVDRYLLTHSRGVGKPVVYAFYMSALSGFVIVLVPFGVVTWPSVDVVELSLLAAAAFIGALILLYHALKESTASDVMPVIAASSASASFLLASVFLDENLPQMFLLAVALFILGTFLISRFRFTRRSFLCVIGAGLLFGLSTFLHKPIFLLTPFWDGFFWSRMANVVGAVLLITWPGNYRAILHGTKSSSKGTKWLVIGNKTLAGIAGAMTFFAISMGSVSVVNAMTGLQFAFLLLLAYLFASHFPNVLKGELERKGFTHKLWGIVCIIAGLAALFLV